jgi:hypothetical protein
MDHPSIRVSITPSDVGPHVSLSDEVAHDTESLDCWCNPTLNRLCPECGSIPEGCWRCVGGLIVLTRAEAGLIDEPLLIVHH